MSQAESVPIALEELVRQAQSIDRNNPRYEAIWDMLFLSCSAIARVAIRMRVSEDDVVEELVADTLADFFELVHKGTKVRYVGALVKTIGSRRAADHIRRRVAEPGNDDMESDSAAPLDSAAEEAFEHVFTNDLLAELPPEHRLFAYLRFGADLTVEQAGARLGMTRDIAKKQSAELNGLLREIATRRGYRDGQ